MAKRLEIVLEDDLSGGPADETVVFGLDGAEYELELNSRNAAAFRQVLDPYVSIARKVSAKSKGRPSSARRRSSGQTVDAKAVRAWAVSQDIAVPGRGRVPKRVIDAYAEAH